MQTSKGGDRDLVLLEKLLDGTGKLAGVLKAEILACIRRLDWGLSPNSVRFIRLFKAALNQTVW